MGGLLEKQIKNIIILRYIDKTNLYLIYSLLLFIISPEELFGSLKENLKVLKFNDLDEFKEKVIEILTQISRDVKNSFFDNWIERCQWIIDNEGANYQSHCV